MYGQHGQIATRGDGRIQCHECGRWYLRLGRHITNSHELTVRDYQIAYGLPVTRGLVAESLRESMADRQRQVMAGPDGDRYRANLDPDAAAQARDPEMARRAPTLRDEGFPARVAATLEAKYPPIVCVVCSTAFRPRERRTKTCSPECFAAWQARNVQRGSRNPARDAEIRACRDAGETHRQIGERYGITPEAIGYILRRDQA